MSYVFVYGSLKRGHWNNSLLTDSDFICPAITLDSNYNMIGLGSFPAVCSGGHTKIEGELYKVDRDTLKRLDSLEGNGSLYTREEVGVAPTDEQTSAWVYAWMYIFSSNISPYYKGVLKNGDRILYDDMINSKSWGF